MFNKYLPSTFNWDYKIVSDVLSEQELSILKKCTIKIKGDPCELVPTKHSLIEFVFQDFDDFEITMILNKLVNNKIIIEIARLNNEREPIIKHSYTDCSIVDSHSFNSRLNGENKLYGKISVKFDWKYRQILRIT